MKKSLNFKRLFIMILLFTIFLAGCEFKPMIPNNPEDNKEDETEEEKEEEIVIPEELDPTNIKFERTGFMDINLMDPKDLNKNKIIDENSKYIMFFDEETGIISLALKNSLISGTDGTKLSDYKIIKSNTMDDLRNFTFHFSNKEKYININKNLYEDCIHYRNPLGNYNEKNYSVKYNTKEINGKNSLIVDYTIGDEFDLQRFFPSKIYKTKYKPAEILYDDNSLYDEKVKEWQGYLDIVGNNLDNTFEERFRGNVQIDLGQRKINQNTYEMFCSNEIRVYSEEALIYLRDVVFGDLYDDGIIDSIPNIDIYNYRRDSLNNPYWIIKNCPEELLNYTSPYYKKYFNNENTPLTNNPFLKAVDYRMLLDTYHLIMEDGNSVLNSFYSENIKQGQHAQKIYSILYGKDLDKDIKYKYTCYNGETIDYLSYGFPKKDSKGNFVYDKDGNLIRDTLSLNEVVKYNKLFDETYDYSPLVKLSIEYELTDNGYTLTILRNSIIDSSNVKNIYKKSSHEYQLYNTGLVLDDITFNKKIDNNNIYLLPGQDGKIIDNDGKEVDNFYNNYMNKNDIPLNPVTSNLIYESFLKIVKGKDGILVNYKNIDNGINAKIDGVKNDMVKTYIKLRDSEDKLFKKDITIDINFLDNTSSNLTSASDIFKNFLSKK